MSTYRVNEGTQVNVDGVTYGPGESFEADPGVAAPWLAAALVTETKPRVRKPKEPPAIQ